jgi:hypothetical protein
MGDLDIYVSRFTINSKSLKEFDEALRFIRGKNEITKTPEVTNVISKLLNVINPIIESINGNLSESIAINERNIAEIIKSKRNREWPIYKENMRKLYSKLTSNSFRLSQSDFQLLNDIADALDAECANLFRRLSEK